jgi:hypothetical protein
MPIPYKANLEKGGPHAVVISYGDVIRKDFVVQDMQFVACANEAAMKRAFKNEVARAESSVEGLDDILIAVGELTSTKPLKVGRVEVRGNADYSEIFGIVQKLMTEQVDLWTVDKFEEVPAYKERSVSSKGTTGAPAKGTAKTRKATGPVAAAAKKPRAAAKSVRKGVVPPGDEPTPRKRVPAKRTAASAVEESPTPKRLTGVRKRLRASGGPNMGFVSFGMVDTFSM